MLMIRLQRVGRKNDPSFRVVLVNHRSAAKTGKAIELLGSHDARVSRTVLEAERIKYWLSVGAKISDTVRNLLIKNKIIDGVKINVSSKKLGKKATARMAEVAKVAATVAVTPTEEVSVTEVSV